MALPPHPQTIRIRTRIPPVYRDGLYPLRWQDDVSGALPAAVAAFCECQIGGPPPTVEQLTLLVEWLIHFICAPCWNAPARLSMAEGYDGTAASLIQLRLDLLEGRVRTADEIAAWIERALEMGIDPL